MSSCSCRYILAFWEIGEPEISDNFLLALALQKPFGKTFSFRKEKNKTFGERHLQKHIIRKQKQLTERVLENL